MPPKKVDPEPEPEHEPEQDNSGKEIVEEVISTLVQESAQQLETRRLDRITIPYSNAKLLNDAFRTSAWSNMTVDIGDPQASTGTDSSWLVEEEPTPASVDAWARGKLEIHSKKKKDEYKKRRKKSESNGTKKFFNSKKSNKQNFLFRSSSFQHSS